MVNLDGEGAVEETGSRKREGRNISVRCRKDKAMKEEEEAPEEGSDEIRKKLEVGLKYCLKSDFY